MQYFIYGQLARMLHRSRDVVFTEGKRYTAQNAADEAILNEHFHRDVIVEPTCTKKQSETSQPIEKQPTEHQMKEPFGDDSPPDPPKPNKMSRKFAGLGTCLGDTGKPVADGCCRNRAGNYSVAESA
jgi:hypothetical protein